MKFHYYGHSCFTLTANDKTLLFDPFIKDNPRANEIDIDSIACDYILLSHGHFDHVTDCAAIAKRTGAKVICSMEIGNWLEKKGLNNLHAMGAGGFWNFGDFKVKCVGAVHGSSLPDGKYGGGPMGFIITMDDKSVYYAGDTALTMDMKLIPHWATIDYAIMPIGNNFTMDATDAAMAAEMVQTKKVIGVHYDTFGHIMISNDAAREKFAKKGLELLLININSDYTMK